MIDLVATQDNYRAHLDPLWAALPAKGALVLRARDRVSDAALVAGHQDLVRARRWGYSRIAYLEHGIGQSYGNGHPAYPGGRERDAVSLFLSPNETAAAMDRAAYPDTRVEVVGCPRLETLPRRVPDGLTTVAVSWHWSGGETPELRSALDHYREALPILARRFHVIGHSHPAPGTVTLLSELYQSLGVEFVPDFDRVCELADVYLVDNSSTLYEFASTNRPVVALNAPWYRRDFRPGLRFWDAADVGIQCDHPDALNAAVASALEYEREVGPWPHREPALDIVYGVREGSAELAAGVVTDWLAGVAAAA